MERLLTCLQELENSTLPDHKDVYLRCSDNDIVGEIESLATSLLISDEGNPLFEEMDMLWQEYGYFIFPGERDRFGWVTGCLQTKKGIIVFG